MVAIPKKKFLEEKLSIPGFNLPEYDQINVTDEIWKVYSAIYEFGAKGLAVPGNNFISIANSNKDRNFTFISKPSILSLSLNYIPLNFTSGEVSIYFEHQQTSSVCTFF